MSAVGRVIVAAAGSVLVLGAFASPGLATSSTTPSDPAPSASASVPGGDQPLVRVYVVDSPSEGLGEIADRFLGDEAEAASILQANSGIVQRDGGVLTAEDAPRPGWILVMPPSASGIGLQVAQAPSGPTLGSAPADLFPVVVSAALVVVIVLALVALWLFARRPRHAAPRTPTGTRAGDRDGWLVDRAVRVMLARCHAEGLRAAEPYLLTIDGERVLMHLAAPRSVAPTPFRASESGSEWYCAVRDIQDTTVDPAVPNPFATLVTVGEIEGELVAVDLAHARGVIQVDGDPDARRVLIAGWGRQLRSAPWADESLPIVTAGFAAGAIAQSRYVDSLATVADEIVAGGPIVVLVDDLDRRDHGVLDQAITALGGPRAFVVGGAHPDPRWSITIDQAGRVSSDLFAVPTPVEAPK